MATQIAQEFYELINRLPNGREYMKCINTDNTVRFTTKELHDFRMSTDVPLITQNKMCFLLYEELIIVYVGQDGTGFVLIDPNDKIPHKFINNQTIKQYTVYMSITDEHPVKLNVVFELIKSGDNFTLKAKF